MKIQISIFFICLASLSYCPTEHHQITKASCLKELLELTRIFNKEPNQKAFKKCYFDEIRKSQNTSNKGTNIMGILLSNPNFEAKAKKL